MKFAFMSAGLILLCKSHFCKSSYVLTIYFISDLSIKNNILRKVMNRAYRAKKI